MAQTILATFSSSLQSRNSSLEGGREREREGGREGGRERGREGGTEGEEEDTEGSEISMTPWHRGTYDVDFLPPFLPFPSHSDYAEVDIPLHTDTAV